MIYCINHGSFNISFYIPQTYNLTWMFPYATFRFGQVDELQMKFTKKFIAPN